MKKAKEIMGHHYVNIGITGFLEGEERENGAESLCGEVMARNFINLRKKMYIQIQEA